MEKKQSTDNVLFGDYFGQRADYSHGLFYGGHRRYLNANGTSSLEPPNEFKSKRQLKMLRLSRQGNSRDERMFQVNFQSKKEQDVDLDLIAQKKVKKVIAYVRDTLVFDHFSSTHPADWMEETQAGVQIWVNGNTGEVSPVCPWIHHEDDKAHGREAPESKEADGAEGTGSLVYDGSELQDLFALLGHGDDSSRRG